MTQTFIPAAGTTSRERDELVRGAVAMLSLLPGYVPFGMLVGVTIAGSSAPWAAASGVWLVFGGSAHLAVVQVVDGGGGLVAAVASAVMVNVRLAAFSATMAPHWRGASVRRKLVAAATVVDPTWMLALRRASEGASPRDVRRFHAGSSLVLWFGWAAVVATGALVRGVLPPEAGLGLLAPLCLTAMVAPTARTRPGLACVAAAVLVAGVGEGLPSGLGILLAMPAGVGAAMLAGRRRADVRAVRSEEGR